jgi:hypothetical protein
MQMLSEIILAVIIFKLSAPIKSNSVSVLSKNEEMNFEDSTDLGQNEIIERKNTYDTELILDEFGSIR